MGKRVKNYSRILMQFQGIIGIKDFPDRDTLIEQSLTLT